jgi:hypothetical protein
VLTGLVATALLVECAQAVLRVGAADVADLLANSVGAAIGVAVGAGVLLARPHPRIARPTRRRLACTAAVCAACAVLLVVGVHLGADRRQADVQQQAATRFAGTTLGDYRAWERADALFERVFDALSAFSDGASDGGDVVQVRYPASFFGVDRCVFVAWVAEAVTVRPAAGTECSEFVR